MTAKQLVSVHRTRREYACGYQRVCHVVWTDGSRRRHHHRQLYKYAQLHDRASENLLVFNVSPCKFTGILISTSTINPKIVWLVISV
jgi:hypothetical protein